MVIILVSMNFSCIFNELFISFSHMSCTIRASLFFTEMRIWSHPKFSMLRANYTNFSFVATVFYFRIIIFIPMNFSCLLNKLF